MILYVLQAAATAARTGIVKVTDAFWLSFGLAPPPSLLANIGKALPASRWEERLREREERPGSHYLS